MIGLDFGTTTTLLAVDGDVVPLGTATEWLPSLVGFDDEGQVVVGEAAESGVPGRIVRSIKRAITRRRNLVRVDALSGVRDVTADEFIVTVLRSVGRRAQAVGLDLSVPGSSRVGCPAVWDGGQRQRYLDLLHRAGIAAVPADLVDEPVAAGIGWIEGRTRVDAPMRLLVFDMGGGTLDIAVIDIHGSSERDVHLLAAVGQASAGDALDETIAADLARELGIDPELSLDIGLPLHQREVRRREALLDAARRLKVRLSTEDEHVVVLPRDLFPGPNEAWYDRPRLRAAFAAQLEEAVQCVTVALRMAHLTAGGSRHDWPPPDHLRAGVDVVLLSGGMSRVPALAQYLRAMFPASTRIELAANPPERAVVLGLTRAARYQHSIRYALPYDIRLEWNEGSESRVLYNAYMPILEQWWIERNWAGEFRFLARGDGLPGHGHGVLRVAAAGAPVAATLNGSSLDGYPVALNGERFSLAIEPDGRLIMVDAAGTHTGRAHGPGR